jgi:tRNA (guanine37-N1)-methyltransferase
MPYPTLRIDLITCLPALVQSPLQHSILQRAQDKGVAAIHVHDLREYAYDKHRSVDDEPYGGGPGMVMRVEPVARAIRALQAERDYDEVIYLSPDGQLLDQGVANALSLNRNLILLAGHYKGIDERIRALFITREISIGDYVLSGGELAALVVIDAVVRLVPGVLNDEASALFDAFQDNLLAPPEYTRPATFEGHQVPAVLRSGDFKRIEAWRYEAALAKTRARRPHLLEEDAPSDTGGAASS